MAHRIFDSIRRTCVAAALLLTAMATGASAEGIDFAWPENPFALTLSDQLFVDTGEARFEKAGRVFGDAMSGIGAELGDIASFPFRDPGTFGIFAVGIGALVMVDVPTTKAYQEHILPIGKEFNLPELVDIDNVTIDSQYLALGVAGTYAWGLAANDERSQVAALLATKAVAYSYLTSHLVLKTAFGRLRPVKDLDNPPKGGGRVFSTSPFDFFNSTGVHFDTEPYATAMPSFHFTMYFSTARVYSGVYDNYLIPYGLATALALQSADGHNHWVSDMVAGALIGTGIGNVILRNYEERRDGINMSFAPIASSKGAGIGFQMTF